MNKRKIIPSLVLNLSISLLMVIGLILCFTLEKATLKLFKYFTTDSNIIMGVSSLIYSIYLILLLNRKTRNIPKGIEMFKLATTVSVVLTFLTVVFFLTPVAVTQQSKDLTPIMLYANSGALFHVAIPVLSFTTWILFEHSSNKYKLPESLFGVIPMFIYSIFYITVALTHIKDGKVPTQYDWYFFCQFGLKWIPLVLIIMYGCTYLISWSLWLGNTKIDIKYQLWTRSQYKRFWAIFINGLIFILFFISMMVRFFHEKKTVETFKYFTTQSNVLMGIMALVCMIFQIVQFKQKEINKTIRLLKLFTTVYIAITFTVTVLMLTPGAAILKIKDWPVSKLYTNSNLLFHVFIPTFAIINWILFEHTNQIKFNKIFYSFIYVALYATFYLSVAYTHIGSDGKIPMQYDWYKFCAFGPGITVLIMILIFGFTFLYSWLFWMANKKVNTLKDVKLNKAHYQRRYKQAKQ